MVNLEIAKILYQIAEILEMQAVQFKPRAYQRAALAIESLSEDVSEIYARGGIKSLKEIPGVGESIAEKIEEFIKTSRIKYYEELKKKLPLDLEELSAVPGLGPKKIRLLYQKLKIKNVAQLKKAAEQHRIRKIPTLGETTEKNILEGIEFAKKSKRFLLGYIMPLAEGIKKQLLSQPYIKKVEIAGSYRRMKETVGDLDILTISSQPKETINFFTRLSETKKVLAQGPTKSTIILKNNLQVDIRVLSESEFGSALQYFTGDKNHNIAVRRIAIKKGYKLSEYGLFKKNRIIAGKTEEEIYKKLGMQTPPPEIRTNTGEIEAALNHQLPVLVDYQDVHADFQMHSTFSDGSNSIEEMARTAKKLGHQIIAITDHMGPLKIAHALDEKRLSGYLKGIEKARKKVPGIKILAGAEVDIDKNGNLTATKKMLGQLDLVLASVHSAFKQPEKVMTQRLLHAFENYPINVFAHPTGRVINVRPGYQFNTEKVFQSARKNNIFLEINAYPDRMDLDAEHIRKAKELGCRFSIGTDSHSQDQLRFVRLGAALARRGWLEKKDILNCWTTNKILKVIKK